MALIDSELPLIEAMYGRNILATNPAQGRLTMAQVDAVTEPKPLRSLIDRNGPVAIGAGIATLTSRRPPQKWARASLALLYAAWRCLAIGQ
jgi:hypothetical protein